LAGVVSTLLATFAAFGLLVFVGAEFTNFNYGAIFIMIGIGQFQFINQ
jgi:predicted RND superfamily exporter protein